VVPWSASCLWWVTLANLGVIWLSAAYRATVSENFLTAVDNDVGTDKHWIGMFRNTLDESLFVTLECANTGNETSDIETITTMESLLDHTNLFVGPSIRTASRTSPVSWVK